MGDCITKYVIGRPEKKGGHLFLSNKSTKDAVAWTSYVDQALWFVVPEQAEGAAAKLRVNVYVAETYVKVWARCHACRQQAEYMKDNRPICEVCLSKAQKDQVVTPSPVGVGVGTGVTREVASDEDKAGEDQESGRVPSADREPSTQTGDRLITKDGVETKLDPGRAVSD